MEIRISEKNLERMQQVYELNEESMCEAVINGYIGNLIEQEQMIQQIEEEQKKLDALKNKLQRNRTVWKM